MLSGLLADSHLMPLEALPARVRENAAGAGLPRVLIYLCDLQRQVLRLLPEEGAGAEGRRARLPVQGTVAGKAFQYGRILPAGPAGAGGRDWWVPLLDGTERMGVLRVTAVHDDDRTRETMERLASLIALILHSRRETSDRLARLERTEPLNVAAEMQWKLMPPRVYADGRVVIAGALEPAYRISGDAFDYATDGPVVHLSVFDAMGHDTAAGLSAALAVGTCRNTRRQGGGLVACGEAVEAELIEQYDQRRYVTGILAALDTRTGVLSWVNRGHHPPVIIRNGRWATHPQCPPAHPMGTGLGLESRVCREQLQPGDRVVLYTDGIVEAGGAGGPRFGIERFTDFLIRHHADGLSVPETLRRVVHAVLEYHGDRLQDDATVLFCQWLGPDPAPSGEAADLGGVPETGRPAEARQNRGVP
ncbi:serine/threonine-protein phosphatase [Streptomyces somaliensis DSM 40738]|uniref:PP2C family protein-serine/threonine phosphatase n=1 Tax=Streptomyces somaliensis TaxID=78355 RepID=UPI0021C287DA|nr:PP2C family protein-serine/threonine phosphatase [Streptomyces somaliensis]MCQ0025555.1 serine/threonine-protein phosphatase [Streptomyces somaliensis DSM 40738]